MRMSPIAVRFVGLLHSVPAEAAAHDCIRALDALCPEVTGWEVRVQPPLGAGVADGYAVRVQARLADGGVLAIRAQAAELVETVRDAFDGMGQLLRQ